MGVFAFFRSLSWVDRFGWLQISGSNFKEAGSPQRLREIGLEEVIMITLVIWGD